ncbi:TerC family protein [Escherichia coli]|nr:TerC family protein [Escherichia coli]
MASNELFLKQRLVHGILNGPLNLGQATHACCSRNCALGIDNLVFIAILADKLPPKQRDKARLLGLSLALIMRLGLLSLISWMVTLTKPLFTVMDFFPSPGRDLIMLFGGDILAVLKQQANCMNGWKIRHHDSGHGKGYAPVSGVVVTQIVILDAVFSLDAVITAVGMVNHLPVMMAALVIAMAVMLLASKPLTRFVNQHPTRWWCSV